MTIRMDEGAAELLDTLHKAGYAAYVVGMKKIAIIRREKQEEKQGRRDAMYPTACLCWIQQ